MFSSPRYVSRREYEREKERERRISGSRCFSTTTDRFEISRDSDDRSTPARAWDILSNFQSLVHFFFFFWRMSARILLQVPKMEERPRWERSGALRQLEARTRSRRYRAREGSARERGWERARGVRPPLSMLRGEFETVVSMLMSVPRFFVRGRLARPLNYFKYFQMSVGGGGGRT